MIQHEPVNMLARYKRGEVSNSDMPTILEAALPTIADQVKNNPEVMRDPSDAEYIMRLPSMLASDIKSGALVINEADRETFDDAENRAAGILQANYGAYTPDNRFTALAVLQMRLFEDEISAPLAEATATPAASMLRLLGKLIHDGYYGDDPSMLRYIFEKAGVAERDLQKRRDQIAPSLGSTATR